MAPIAVRSLSVGYRTEQGLAQVLSDIDLELPANRIVGLAGESGSGKSTLALSMAGYRSSQLVQMAGSVQYRGISISSAPLRQMRHIWGAQVAYLPQDTSTALNPALRVGSQLVEALTLHHRARRSAARRKATELLDRVGIPNPGRAVRKYPHQFSGGQQQRIALAVALAPAPSVLILDEPTTGLDVTIQALINELIVSLVRERRMATLYVSHNLALLATVCDDLTIMYAGQVVESGPVATVYFRPAHPYTKALIEAVPSIAAPAQPRGIPGAPPPTVLLERCSFGDRCPQHSDQCDRPIALENAAPGHAVRCVLVVPRKRGEPRDYQGDRGQEEAPGSELDRGSGRLSAVPAGDNTFVGPAESQKAPGLHGPEIAPALLDISDLSVSYGKGPQAHLALDGISFAVEQGEVLGIVGESGSGKSTLARTVVGLLEPSAGQVHLNGAPLAPSCANRPPAVRQAIQIVFQNPDASLNPRQSVRAILDHPLKKFMGHLSASERRARRSEVIERLRLPARVEERYPRELSGGQRQRVALARALVAEPTLLLCDEVTSALDVSVQASILELLQELTKLYRLTMLFVTHDLGVLQSIADRVVVLEAGQIREVGAVRDVLAAPQHRYTRTLVASVPDPLQRAAPS